MNSQGDPWNSVCSWQELTMHLLITVRATTVLAIHHYCTYLVSLCVLLLLNPICTHRPDKRVNAHTDTRTTHIVCLFTVWCPFCVPAWICVFSCCAILPAHTRPDKWVKAHTDKRTYNPHYLPHYCLISICVPTSTCCFQLSSRTHAHPTPHTPTLTHTHAPSLTLCCLILATPTRIVFLSSIWSCSLQLSSLPL